MRKSLERLKQPSSWATTFLITGLTVLMAPASKAHARGDCTISAVPAKLQYVLSVDDWRPFGLSVDGKLTHSFKTPWELLAEITRLESFGICTRRAVECELGGSDDRGVSIVYRDPHASWFGFKKKTLIASDRTTFVAASFQLLSKAGLCVAPDAE